MKKHFYLFKAGLCALAVGLLAGCSEEVDGPQTADGRGAVKLSISADAGFETTTKAVNEESYKNTDNYTVQILTNTGSVVETYTGATLPKELIELTNGSYSVKAFYGTDVPASTETMYVEGSKNFDINSDQVSNVNVSCAPVCARVQLTYDESLSTYFKDWEAVFTTKALTAQGVGNTFTYTKEMTDPLYLKVEQNESVSVNFQFTNSENKVTPVSESFIMNPNEAVNITIKPQAAETGNLGITIEIDGTTNDETINIEIPSEWV